MSKVVSVSTPRGPASPWFDEQFRVRAHGASSPTTTSRRVQAYAFQERVPPTEIQLWNVGDNPTDYGVHKWTARSAELVVGRYAMRGNPLLIDIEHNGPKLVEGTNEDEPAVTGGYARLELRAGAPWLVFEWSAYAVEQIATGQRRFLSPEYDVDTKTGEIVGLYCVSLVANPATHRARMLAAAPQQETGMDPKLAAIMAILSSVADPAAAIDAIKSLVANLDGGDAPPGDAPPADAIAAGDAPPPGDAPDKDKMAAAQPPATPAPGAAPIAAAAPAATPPAPPPAAPPVPPLASTQKVDAAAGAAVLQIENAQRDHLITTEGERLDPSIRRWAASQPLAVVKGLISAAPAKQDPPMRASATRGDTQGQPPPPKGLEGEDLKEFERSMGIVKATALEPHVTPGGVLVLPSVSPSVHRERKRAAAAAAASAAGKVGK